MTMSELLTQIMNLSISSNITILTGDIIPRTPIAKSYQCITPKTTWLTINNYLRHKANQIVQQFNSMQIKSILVSCLVRNYQVTKINQLLSQLAPLLIKANCSNTIWHSSLLTTASSDYTLVNLFLTNNNQPHLIHPGLVCAQDLCQNYHFSLKDLPVQQLANQTYVWHEKPIADYFTKQITYLMANQKQINQVLMTKFQQLVKKLSTKPVIGFKSTMPMQVLDLNWLYHALNPQETVAKNKIKHKLTEPEIQLILRYLAQVLAK